MPWLQPCSGACGDHLTRQPRRYRRALLICLGLGHTRACLLGSAVKHAAKLRGCALPKSIHPVSHQVLGATKGSPRRPPRFRAGNRGLLQPCPLPSDPARRRSLIPSPLVLGPDALCAAPHCRWRPRPSSHALPRCLVSVHRGRAMAAPKPRALSHARRPPVLHRVQASPNVSVWRELRGKEAAAVVVHQLRCRHRMLLRRRLQSFALGRCLWRERASSVLWVLMKRVGGH